MRLTHLLAAPVLLAAATAHAATLTVTPDQTVYQVGDLITLNVLGDAEGAASFAIGGRLLFDSSLVEYVDATQIELQSEGGQWDDFPLVGGDGFATAFNQGAQPFGFLLVPINLLEARVILQATNSGVLDVNWSTEGFTFSFFGLNDAPGTSVTIVPEPSSFVLVGLALTLLAARRRNR